MLTEWFFEHHVRSSLTAAALEEAPSKNLWGFFSFFDVALSSPKIQAMALRNSVGSGVFCRQGTDAFIPSPAWPKASAMERARCCHLQT